MKTNALGEGWGVVLKQRQQDLKGKIVEVVFSYYLGVWKGAQLNYHSTRQEVLATKMGIKKF